MIIENDGGGVDDDAIRHGHDQGQGGGGQAARTYTHVLAPFTLVATLGHFYIYLQNHKSKTVVMSGIVLLQLFSV